MYFSLLFQEVTWHSSVEIFSKLIPARMSFWMWAAQVLNQKKNFLLPHWQNWIKVLIWFMYTSPPFKWCSCIVQEYFLYNHIFNFLEPKYLKLHIHNNDLLNKHSSELQLHSYMYAIMSNLLLNKFNPHSLHFPTSMCT